MGKALGQQQRLVEAPGLETAGVQGHRQEQIGLGHQLQAIGALEPALQEGLKDDLLAELEALDGRSHRPLIERRGPGPGKGRRLGLAVAAEAVAAVWRFKHPPAAGAQWASYPVDLPLALRADRLRRFCPHPDPAKEAHSGQEELQHGQAEALEPIDTEWRMDVQDNIKVNYNRLKAVA